MYEVNYKNLKTPNKEFKKFIIFLYAFSMLVTILKLKSAIRTMSTIKLKRRIFYDF